MLLSASVGKSRRAIGDGASGRIFVSFHPDCSEPTAHWDAEARSNGSRPREGIAKAKAAGVYKGRPVRGLICRANRS
jgi:hypothetical protein